MLGGFNNIGRVPELRKRLFFVLIMIFVYRIGVHIPTPGVNVEVISDYFSSQGSLLGMLDMFSGGAMSQLSIFSLGIMPYISASIIMELLTVVVPHLEALKKEGQSGRRKINQYARYATVGLAMLQGLMISVGLENLGREGELAAVLNPGWGFRLTATLTLASGTAFIMWLGEQMTERGIGNGISLIIFSGIVAGLPGAIGSFNTMIRSNTISPFLAVLLVIFMVAVVMGTVFCERGQRRIPVQYAQRMVGRRLIGGRSTHLPLKINPAGVIPPIFASSLIMFPATIGQFAEWPFLQSMAQLLAPGMWLHDILYVVLIVFFCYFYTGVTFNPVDVADNMKKNGGFIPGIRPGAKTAEYIDRVLTRLTLGGALYISLVCLLPGFLMTTVGVPFYFGGTALLIVVGVALDLVGQIETHLLSRQYEGFLKKGLAGRVRG